MRNRRRKKVVHLRNYGTLVALWDPPTLNFVLEGSTSPNARTAFSISLLRKLLPDVATGRGLVFMQYDDHVHNDLCSIAFGRRRNEASAVTLVPDAYFLGSEAYSTLRSDVLAGKLPSWSDRRDVVFWRGTSTYNDQIENITHLEEVPRVRLCLHLRDLPGTDAGIFATWGNFSPEHNIPRLEAERIFRPGVSAGEQARHRYLIDIDGVANAWGFFEKLLMGSCVLKVGSPFEQWFYNTIAPWKHYVPISADLSDLQERIDWCRENPGAAEVIAAAGQAFALGVTYDEGMRILCKGLEQSFTPF